MTTPPRFRLLHLAGLLALVLVTLGPGCAGQAVARTNDDLPLDLAAMALRPSDLVAEGLEGHGITTSILSERSSDIGAFVRAWDGRVRDSEVFEATDPDRTYILDLSRDVDVGEYLSSSHLVASWTMEFAGDEAAREGIATMSETLLAQEGTDEVRSRTELGDEQFLVSGTGLDTIRNADFERMTLAFRVDNLVSGITILNYRDTDAPTRALMESLGERQLERVEDVLDGDAPGLSGQFLHLRVPGDMVNVTYYLALDGEAMRTSTNTDDAFADRQALYDDSGIASVFHSEVMLGDNAYFNNTLQVFTSDAAAIAFLEHFEDEYRQFPDDMVEAPSIGDGAFASGWIEEEGSITHHRYRIFVRVGATVFLMTHHIAAPGTGLELQPDAINGLAERQAECLTGDASCARTFRVPRDLLAA